MGAYSRMFGPKSAGTIVREAVLLELTYTAHDMAPFARDLGFVDDAGAAKPPFRWDDDRRLRLRTKLDALYFILYGVIDPADPVQGRDDVRYIYSTFPIVEREEARTWDATAVAIFALLGSTFSGRRARCPCGGLTQSVTPAAGLPPPPRKIRNQGDGSFRPHQIRARGKWM